ncbi:MAG: hypothetical protein AAF628_23715 [Planctomycetota bacterium]
MGDESYLVLQGRFFDDLTDSDDVHPWSLMIGYTVPLTAIADTIFN